MIGKEGFKQRNGKVQINVQKLYQVMIEEAVWVMIGCVLCVKRRKEDKCMKKEQEEGRG